MWSNIFFCQIKMIIIITCKTHREEFTEQLSLLYRQYSCLNKMEAKLTYATIMAFGLYSMSYEQC